jgi:hypothetical protein
MKCQFENREGSKSNGSGKLSGSEVNQICGEAGGRRGDLKSK